MYQFTYDKHGKTVVFGNVKSLLFENFEFLTSLPNFRNCVTLKIRKLFIKRIINKYIQEN